MSIRILLVSAVLLAVPATALAVAPTKGAVYSNQKVLSFADVAKSGRTAKIVVNGGKCGKANTYSATKTAKISSSGVLTYSGKAKSLASPVPATINVTGKFTTATKLKWTVKIKIGTCKETVKIKIGTCKETVKTTLTKA